MKKLLPAAVLTLVFVLCSTSAYSSFFKGQEFWDSHNCHLSPPFSNYTMMFSRNDIISDVMPHTMFSISTFWKHIVWQNISYEIGISFFKWHQFSEEEHEILQSFAYQLIGIYPDVKRKWQILHGDITVSYNLPLFNWMLVHAGFGGTIGYFSDRPLFDKSSMENTADASSFFPLHGYGDSGLLIRTGVSFAIHENFLIDIEYFITFMHKYTDWHGIQAVIYLMW